MCPTSFPTKIYGIVNLILLISYVSIFLYNFGQTSNHLTSLKVRIVFFRGPSTIIIFCCGQAHQVALQLAYLRPMMNKMLCVATNKARFFRVV